MATIRITVWGPPPAESPPKSISEREWEGQRSDELGFEPESRNEPWIYERLAYGWAVVVTDPHGVLSLHGRTRA